MRKCGQRSVSQRATDVANETANVPEGWQPGKGPSQRGGSHCVSGPFVSQARLTDLDLAE